MRPSGPVADASHPIAPDDRLARALEPDLIHRDATGILLAVSGGPDSTALMHAAAALRSHRPLHVATVDHGLRPEARSEAEAVGRLAANLGLPHRILTWDAPRRTGGVQAAARAARYRLLADHAASLGAGLVMTGHTSDDQAETVLMRLVAGSGPAGLAGMRARRALAPGIDLARPFLALPKAALVAYCRSHGLPTLRDPSNADERFARARLRRLLPVLAAEGLTPERLRRLAARLARDAAALDRRAASVLAECRLPAGPGCRVLDGRRLAAEPDALVLRVLDAALEDVTETPGGRRLERLERLVLDALLPALRGATPLRRTLRGVLVEATGSGEVRLVPAPPRRLAGRAASPGRGADGLAAGTADLLGKGEGAAYIGRE